MPGRVIVQRGWALSPGRFLGLGLGLEGALGPGRALIAGHGAWDYCPLSMAGPQPGQSGSQIDPQLPPVMTFAAHHARKRFGQHWLIDTSVLDRIVAAAELTETEAAEDAKLNETVAEDAKLDTAEDAVQAKKNKSVPAPGVRRRRRRDTNHAMAQQSR